MTGVPLMPGTLRFRTASACASGSARARYTKPLCSLSFSRMLELLCPSSGARRLERASGFWTRYGSADRSWAGSETASSTPSRSVIEPRRGLTTSSVRCSAVPALRSVAPRNTSRYIVREHASASSTKNSRKIVPARCWTKSTVRLAARAGFRGRFGLGLRFAPARDRGRVCVSAVWLSPVDPVASEPLASLEPPASPLAVSVCPDSVLDDSPPAASSLPASAPVCLAECVSDSPAGWTGVCSRAAAAAAPPGTCEVRRKRNSVSDTGLMPSRAASWRIRSGEASSAFSIPRVAFSRSSVRSRSSERPMPTLSFSSPICSVTIPISAKAITAIDQRPRIMRSSIGCRATRVAPRPTARSGRGSLRSLLAGWRARPGAGPEIRRGGLTGVRRRRRVGGAVRAERAAAGAGLTAGLPAGACGLRAGAPRRRVGWRRSPAPKERSRGG